MVHLQGGVQFLIYRTAARDLVGLRPPTLRRWRGGSRVRRTFVRGASAGVHGGLDQIDAAPMIRSSFAALLGERPNGSSVLNQIRAPLPLA